MNHATLLILTAAFSIGFIHTLMGPDHYIPFIVLSRARCWSLIKTLTVTTLCGIGHVLSAALIGVIAVSLGLSLSKLTWVESVRGSFAIWLLIGFGFVYFLWGFYQLKSSQHHHPHDHIHIFGNHIQHKNWKEITPWALFIIFVLGPCEPLIPLMMYPAIQGSILNVCLVTLLFGLATLFTMLSVVTATFFGLEHLPFHFLGKYGHMLAGAVIFGSGVAIKIFGL